MKGEFLSLYCSSSRFCWKKVAAHKLLSYYNGNQKTQEAFRAVNSCFQKNSWESWLPPCKWIDKAQPCSAKVHSYDDNTDGRATINWISIIGFLKLQASIWYQRATQKLRNIAVPLFHERDPFATKNERRRTTQTDNVRSQSTRGIPRYWNFNLQLFNFLLERYAIDDVIVGTESKITRTTQPLETALF